jgi:hypothetical protein
MSRRRIKLHLDANRFRWIDSASARRLRREDAATKCSEFPYELRLRSIDELLKRPMAGAIVSAFMEKQAEIIRWREKSDGCYCMQGKMLRRIPK